jgi:hypothetical protein
MELHFRITAAPPGKPTVARAVLINGDGIDTLIDSDTLDPNKQKARREFCERVVKILGRNGQTVSAGDAETIFLQDLQTA